MNVKVKTSESVVRKNTSSEFGSDPKFGFVFAIRIRRLDGDADSTIASSNPKYVRVSGYQHL